MNSRKRRAACRASLYKPDTGWLFRGKRLTVTRVVSPTVVRVEWPEGARTYGFNRVLEVSGQRA